MNENLAEDFRSLGLESPASGEKVEDAYARKLALYAQGSLATYALFDEEAREAYLRRLELAYGRIRAAHAGGIRRLPSAAEGGTKEAERRGEIPDPAVSPGSFLRAHRLQADLTLREVADRTKVSSAYLRQIEEERFSALPAPVYLRGFVLAYARALGLSDPEGISRLFLQRHQEEVSAPCG